MGGEGADVETYLMLSELNLLATEV